MLNGDVDYVRDDAGTVCDSATLLRLYNGHSPAPADETAGYCAYVKTLPGSSKSEKRLQR